MDGEVDISGLDKAELLAALYNSSRQFGMGFIHASGQNDMTVEEARAMIDPKSDPGPGLLPWEAEDAKRLKFDYVRGRVLKVRIDGDTMRTALYNRDIGHGAAEAVVKKLRASKSVAA